MTDQNCTVTLKTSDVTVKADHRLHMHAGSGEISAAALHILSSTQKMNGAQQKSVFSGERVTHSSQL